MVKTKYADKNLQDKANLGLADLLTNKVDHLKTTSYSRFFDNSVERDINRVRPNEYYVSPKKKSQMMDPLQTAFRSIGRGGESMMGSTQQTTFSQQLQQL